MKPLTFKEIPWAENAPKSVFDEAREMIAEWEQADPNAEHIAMALDGEKDIVVSVAGKSMQPSAAAGLFFTAAHMVLE